MFTGSTCKEDATCSEVQEIPRMPSDSAGMISHGQERRSTARHSAGNSSLDVSTNDLDGEARRGPVLSFVRAHPTDRA